VSRAAARLLTVTAGGEGVAIPAAAVRTVLRPRPLTRLPHAPAALLGLAAHRGAALPVVSLARLLGREPGAPGPGARIVVVATGAGEAGLFVESVAALGPGDGARAVEPGALLAQGLGMEAAAGEAPAPRAAPTAAPAPGTVRSFVAFAVAGQDFALPIGTVEAVARLPPVTPLPGGEAAMLGVAPYRGGLLPLVSPHRLLGLPAPAVPSARTRIVVTRLGALRVGLVADAVTAVLRLPAGSIDPVPAVLTRGTGEARVEAIGRLADGARLVSILSPERLFDAATTARLRAGGDGADAPEPAAAVAAAEERVVLFRLGGETYGVPAAAVREVARRPPRLSALPRAPGAVAVAPDAVAGLMSLRGAALPVIEARCRFGPEGRAPGRGGRVLVLQGPGGGLAGLAVDATAGMAAFPAAALVPAPGLAIGRGAVLARAALRAEGMVLLVDPAALLEEAGRALSAGAP